MLNGEAEALISLPLFAEYEAVLGRPETRRRCPLTAMEQTQLLDAFLSRTRLVEVYYRWRPNLPDEGDNHVLELAVAAGDAPIVTFNQLIGGISAVVNCVFRESSSRRRERG